MLNTGIIASRVVVTECDPYWNNVASLLHFNGTNGSTTFTDQTGKVWTHSGNAQIDTAQSKFGGASGLFDGLSDWITTPPSLDFEFGSGDFTVEMFVRVSALTNQVFIGARNDPGYTPFGIGIFGSKLQMLISKTGTSWAATAADTVNFTTNTWIHIALVRNGTSVVLYKNGVSAASATVSGNLMTFENYLQVGAWGTSEYYVNGHIDELRITKGVARYTTSFTPPDKQFEDIAC